MEITFLEYIIGKSIYESKLKLNDKIVNRLKLTITKNIIDSFTKTYDTIDFQITCSIKNILLDVKTEDEIKLLLMTLRKNLNHIYFSYILRLSKELEIYRKMFDFVRMKQCEKNDFHLLF